MPAPNRPAPARMPAFRRGRAGPRPSSFASSTPFHLGAILGGNAGAEKNGGGHGWDLRPGVALLHLTRCGLRGTFASSLSRPNFLDQPCAASLNPWKALRLFRRALFVWGWAPRAPCWLSG